LLKVLNGLWLTHCRHICELPNLSGYESLKPSPPHPSRKLLDALVCTKVAAVVAGPCRLSLLLIMAHR
jgi:hypothetical protein